MDDGNDQVGWTQAQWNRVREEVLRGWQQVRVAGSFLNAYGPLPPSTEVVPAEVFGSDGTIDDQTTAVVLEISLPVRLTRQQVREEDLSSALSQFRRTAMQVGQLEDWYIFNGGYPLGGPQSSNKAIKASAVDPNPLQLEVPRRPAASFANPRKWPLLTGVEEPIKGVDPRRLQQSLLQQNPGAVGLIEGAANLDDPATGFTVPSPRRPKDKLNNQGLMGAIVSAITALEQYGYVAPHVCVFGRGPFGAANRPVSKRTTAVPRNVLEPLIGREILHASAIDVLPKQAPSPTVPLTNKDRKAWENRGLLLSLAGDPVDLAIVAEATPEFRQVDLRGLYVFSVFERFALRIKDRHAIVALAFD